MLSKGNKMHTEYRKKYQKRSNSVYLTMHFCPPQDIFRYKLKHKGKQQRVLTAFDPSCRAKNSNCRRQGFCLLSCTEPTFKSHRSGPPLSSGWSVGFEPIYTAVPSNAGWSWGAVGRQMASFLYVYLHWVGSLGYVCVLNEVEGSRRSLVSL